MTILSPNELQPKIKVARLNRKALIIAIIVVCAIAFILLFFFTKQDENTALLQKQTMNPKLEPSPIISMVAKPLERKSENITPLIKDAKPTPEEDSNKKLQAQLLDENAKARTAPAMVSGFAPAEGSKPPAPKAEEVKPASLSEGNYLPAERTAALSPYELKAGSLIHAVMISGINSDLPGNIIAQVRENIYDTRTGNYLLIPQGARLFGRYDNQVAYGQSRVLVAWDRIIFPDTSSINLASMGGSDSSGYAGFTDQVNNHYGRIFGSAILMSVLEAGAQLSQPQTSTANAVPTTSQVIGASIGNQLAQTGNQLVQKNLSIQPTLEIRPGYEFNVMVSKDIIFPATYSPMQIGEK
jgi:type IV secretory pathway VirB10-like protein